MKRLRVKRTKQPVPQASASTALTPDERALWSHVASSVQRIVVKSRVTRRGSSTLADADDASLDVAGRTTPEPRRPAATDHVSAVASKPASPNRPARTVVGAPAAVEARKVKKLSKGRSGIEARLDLHGLRQHEAHSLLRNFIRDCQARGLKFVLVITGKGRDDDDASLSFGAMMERTPRGVLRRSVPMWLADIDLRSSIVGYSTAAAHHGGEGAFYVELRRLK